MTVEDLKATLDRSFADQMWSKDGAISEASWATGEKVVLEAGILKSPVSYNDIIDMQFVKAQPCPTRYERSNRAKAANRPKVTEKKPLQINHLG